MSKAKIIQSAKLYLQKEGEKEMRHLPSWPIFLKVCEDLELSTAWKDRTFLDDEDFPSIGKPITEWPEGEEPSPNQRKMSILWMGCQRWANEFGGTHIVGFHEPCKPWWYEGSKVKLITYFKYRSNDEIREVVKQFKNHPNNGGFWTIEGHEADITGGHPSVEEHKQIRIEQYQTIRKEDSNAWDHPVVTFFDMTSSKDFDPGAYPGWEGAFTGDDHDVWIIDCYPNKKDGTLDYRGMEKAANVLCKIGFERSGGQFIPNLGACYMGGNKPASLVKQWEFWNERFGPLKGVCFWNSGVGSKAIGIYEDDYLAEEAKEINRRLELLK